MEPKIGIVTINWNHFDDTVNCVMSLLALSYTHTHIYVVDNASDNDEAGKLIAKFSDQKNVTIIRCPENTGYAGGNNVGLQQAIKDGFADGIWFVNNDATVAPDSLQLIVQAAEQDPTIGAIGATILYPDQHTVYALGGGTFSAWTGIDHLRGARQPIPDQIDPSTRLQYISGAALYLTSAGITVSQGFYPAYFLYSEELDLCLRLKKSGLQLLYVPAAQVIHQSAVSTGHLSPTYVYYFLRNRLLLMHRQITPWKRPSYLLVFLGYYVLGFMILLVSNKKTSSLRYVWQAITDACRGRWGRQALLRS